MKTKPQKWIKLHKEPRGSRPIAFERFVRPVCGSAGGGCAISVGTAGRITLLNGTHPHFPQSHVVLFYDRTAKVIGIHPAAAAEEGAMPLTRLKTSLFFFAKSFFDYYAIPFAGTTRYPAQWDPRRGMLLVSIRK